MEHHRSQTPSKPRGNTDRRAKPVGSNIDRRIAIARSLGVQIVEVGEPFELNGVLYPRLSMKVRDNEHAMLLFDAFAHDDALHDQGAREIALMLARKYTALAPGAERELAIAREIHRYVRDNIHFQPEARETNRSASVTMKLGMGDCDDQAGLVVALNEAARDMGLTTGGRARVTPLRDGDGVIVHAVPVVHAGGRDWWSESTVAAKFGEAPFDAVARLGLESVRRDVAGGRAPAGIVRLTPASRELAA